MMVVNEMRNQMIVDDVVKSYEWQELSCCASMVKTKTTVNQQAIDSYSQQNQEISLSF